MLVFSYARLILSSLYALVDMDPTEVVLLSSDDELFDPGQRISEESSCLFDPGQRFSEESSKLSKGLFNP